MIKTAESMQGADRNDAGDVSTVLAPTASGGVSSGAGSGNEHSVPVQTCVHRYQFPPADDDQDAEPVALVQTPVNINFHILRKIVRRVRKRNIDHRRKAEDAGYAEGQQRGYQDGFEAGRLAGLHESRQQSQQQQQDSADQWLALINNLWNELYNLHQSTLLHLGQPLIELITRVVKQVVNHELATSRESLQQLVTDSLAMLPDIKGVVLIINPVDRPLIEPVVNKIPEGWSIREDSNITAGGCRLITDHGDVDATVESRLMACIDSVHEQLMPA